MPTCALSPAYDLLGKKCMLHILKILSYEQPKRFKDFMGSLNGVSSKTLSERLKELESEGLVERNVFRETPPRVEYSLTVKGEGLVKQLKGIDAWIAKWGSA